MNWTNKNNCEYLKLTEFELKINRNVQGMFYLIINQNGCKECQMLYLEANNLEKAKKESLTAFLDWIHSDLEKKKSAMYEVLKILNN